MARQRLRPERRRTAVYQELRDKLLDRIGFEGVDVGPLCLSTRIDKQYRPASKAPEGNTLAFVSRSRSASPQLRAKTAVTVQPSFACLAVAPEYPRLTSSIARDLRDAVRDVLPFASQVNVAFAPFFDAAEPALRSFIEQEANLAALSAGVLEARAEALAGHLYFLKQKQQFLRDKGELPALLNPDHLQAELPSWPRLLARTARGTPTAFLKRLQGQGFDGLLLATASVEEAEQLIKDLRPAAPASLDFQVETPIASFADVDRLRRAGYSRIFLPQEALLQQVVSGQQGPYRLRDFFKSRQPLN